MHLPYNDTALIPHEHATLNHWYDCQLPEKFWFIKNKMAAIWKAMITDTTLRRTGWRSNRRQTNLLLAQRRDGRARIGSCEGTWKQWGLPMMRR